MYTYIFILLVLQKEKVLQKRKKGGKISYEKTVFLLRIPKTISSKIFKLIDIEAKYMLAALVNKKCLLFCSFLLVSCVCIHAT
jgi:hypothetical protein